MPSVPSGLAISAAITAQGLGMGRTDVIGPYGFSWKIAFRVFGSFIVLILNASSELFSGRSSLVGKGKSGSS